MTSQDASVSLEENPDGSKKISFSAYALALMATREPGNAIEVRQEAAWTGANSDTEAHDIGLTMAREKWPTAEGWSHQAAIRKMNIVLDLLSKDSKS